MLRAICAFIALLVYSQFVDAAIANLSDDFQSGEQGWAHGMRSVNPPFTTSGGPGGAGDDYLQVFSNGSGGASGRWAVFNNTSATWTGDYLAAGIDQITAHVNNDPDNTGTSNLVNIRLGISTTAGSGTGQFVTNAIAIAPGSGWVSVTWSLAPGDLIDISGGSANAANVLMNVAELRFIDNVTPVWVANPGTGEVTLGLDNVVGISAVPEPACTSMLAVGLAGFMVHRRRKLAARQVPDQS